MSKSVTTFLWVAVAAAIAWLLYKKFFVNTAGRTIQQTTGTQTGESPFWSGWNVASNTAQKNQTATVSDWVNAGSALVKGVGSLFGGFNQRATGASTNPTTNGSGTSLPATDISHDRYIPGILNPPNDGNSTLFNPADYMDNYNNSTDVPADPNASSWG